MRFMRTMVLWRPWAVLCLAMMACPPGLPAAAAPPELIVRATPHGFAVLEKRLERAIKAAGMLRVFKASASRAAKARGIGLAGDSVYGVFRNDFAVRMLRANPLAGTEAPILIHAMAMADGTTRLAYKRPSALFARYEAADGSLKALGDELDAIFAQIVEDAAGPE